MLIHCFSPIIIVASVMLSVQAAQVSPSPNVRVCTVVSESTGNGYYDSNCMCSVGEKEQELEYSAKGLIFPMTFFGYYNYFCLLDCIDGNRDLQEMCNGRTAKNERKWRVQVQGVHEECRPGCKVGKQGEIEVVNVDVSK